VVTQQQQRELGLPVGWTCSTDDTHYCHTFGMGAVSSHATVQKNAKLPLRLQGLTWPWPAKSITALLLWTQRATHSNPPHEPP
jgi:hypothetical protein